MDPRALFLEHLAWIERVAATVGRRNSLGEDEVEDFASQVKMKLIEDDYDALRKFRGESAITTYLATLVVRHFHEYARERWGRWRPSAAAERLGQPAKDLEALVYRDGYRLEEAAEKLRTEGRTTASDAELARLFAGLPKRAPLRPMEVGPDPLEWAPGGGLADGRVTATEAEERRRLVTGALSRVLRRLDPEDQVIVRMHLMEDRTVADVARALNLPQKPLYRRIERLRALLRAGLEGEGISKSDARELLEDEDQ